MYKLILTSKNRPNTIGANSASADINDTNETKNQNRKFLNLALLAVAAVVVVGAVSYWLSKVIGV